MGPGSAQLRSSQSSHQALHPPPGAIRPPPLSWACRQVWPAAPGCREESPKCNTPSLAQCQVEFTGQSVCQVGGGPVGKPHLVRDFPKPHGGSGPLCLVCLSWWHFLNSKSNILPPEFLRKCRRHTGTCAGKYTRVCVYVYTTCSSHHRPGVMLDAL